ncbi:hypothetical protein RRG08_004074 [Elysia crispata]|uniref:Uncharacterized protein n=1 Tax=Elysia crispata TaxID=231223 RepID=A0AAE0YR24_9GAST|nr:hypothetical protein RRG08_004074 [Elysia crispata]
MGKWRVQVRYSKQQTSRCGRRFHKILQPWSNAEHEEFLTRQKSRLSTLKFGVTTPLSRDIRVFSITGMPRFKP